MKKQLLLFLVTLLPLFANAHDAKIDDIYYNFSGNEATVTFCEWGVPYYGAVVIPESVTYGGKTYRVTSIGDSAFRNCGSLTSVTIPNSVTGIGEMAFEDCCGLLSITIPNSVISIGKYAFSGCSSLISVTIPNSVNNLYSSTFSGCSQLAIVNLDNNAIVSGNGDNSMSSIFGKQVKEYVIGTSVKNIGNYAFSGCTGLKVITLPESVTSIGDYAFQGCNALRSINIPQNVTSIGRAAFSGCSDLTAIDIPESVTKISSETFEKCWSLTSITIPESVTSIGNSAFSRCSSLTSITLPENLTDIGYRTFYYCSSLTSITIPKNIISIGESAFAGCSGLSSIIVEDSNTKYDSRNNCNAIIETGTNTLIVGCKNSFIPENVTSIGEYAFSDCRDLTSITIHNGVFNIGSGAFYNCSGLILVTLDSDNITSHNSMKSLFGDQVREYVIGNYVKSIGENAFSGCRYLTTINIPNSVTYIGDFAFQDCNNLTSVTLDNDSIVSASRTNDTSIKSVFGNQVNEYVIGNSVRSIGKNAFSGCSGLISVTISNSVTSIDDWAFLNCGSMTSVTIPNSVISIGAYVFRSCSNLSSVTIGSSVKSIGDAAFLYCDNLQKVVLPDIAAWCGISFLSKFSNPLVYANHIFSDEETEITELVIPDGVTNIGSMAFGGCSSIVSVSIPNSVTNINIYAFYGCSGLASVTLDNNAIVSAERTYDTSIKSIFGDQVTEYIIGNFVTSIGKNAFYKCNGLTSVTIGNSVTSIGDHAFQNCSVLTSITIGSGVTSIGENAFRYCESLQKVIVSDIAAWCCITFIDNPLFYAHHIYSDEETEITDLVIPDGVTSISNKAFIGCSSLTSVTIGSGVTSIDDSAFESCSGLQKVIIPDITTWCGIKFGNYDANPLYYAHHIISDENTETTELVIPESVTSIGYIAFLGCSDLISVTIPNSVTSIGSESFKDCDSLIKVVVDIEKPIPITRETFSNCKYATLYVPVGCEMFYQEAEYWQDFKEIVEIITTSYISIDGIIYKLNKETKTALVCRIDSKDTDSITIPSSIIIKEETYSVTEIGECAFSGCRYLRFVAIPQSIVSIGNSAFFGCTGLTNIILGNNITSIGDRAFESCTGMTSVTIPNSVTNIGNSAFRGCTGLTDIIIGNNVTSIGGRAFEGCIGMTSITIPNRITNISDFTFRGCTGMTSIIIPNSVINIGNSAFESCTGLTDINIGNSVTRIGKQAFEGCCRMTSITIPKSLTSIGKWAFRKCDELIKIVVEQENPNYDSRNNCNAIIKTRTNELIVGCRSTIIPQNVTSIGVSAFEDCTGLTSITIPGSVTNIGVWAFSGCNGLESVTIPSSVEDIWNDAFYNCTSLTSVTLKSEAIVSASRTSETSMKSIFGDQVQNYLLEEVDEIGDYAFCGCGCLTSVTIPNSVNTIGKSAFYDCSGLTSVILDSDAIVSKSRKASNSMKSIFGDQVTKYVIGDYVKSIGNSAFNDCRSLTSVIIGGSVTSIGDLAFNCCSNITAINIPESVTYIGVGAFKLCSSMKDVFCYAEVIPDTGNNVFTDSYIKSTTLHVPQCSIESYKATSPWSIFGNIVPLTEDEINDVIKEVENSQLTTDNVERYDLQGRKLAISQKGINIIRYSDGTTKNILVK